MRAFTEALQLDPDHVPSLAGMARIRFSPQAPAPAIRILKRALAHHHRQTLELLEEPGLFQTLRVSYGHLLSHPQAEAECIGTFLDRKLDTRAMRAAIRPDLYRVRTGAEPE